MTRKNPTAAHVRISVEDIRLLEWIIRWKQSSVPQMARMFGVSQQAIYKRTSRLQAAGLLGMSRIVVGWHAFFWATPVAYSLLGSPYTPVEPRLTTVEHAAGCVDLAVDYERAYPGIVTSEREIASALYRANKALPRGKGLNNTGVTVRGRGPWTYREGVTHCPDLTITVDGRLHGIEMEVVAKTDLRLLAVLLGYWWDVDEVGKCRWGSVTYFVKTAGQVARIEKIAARLTANWGPPWCCRRSCTSRSTPSPSGRPGPPGKTRTAHHQRPGPRHGTPRRRPHGPVRASTSR